MAKRRVDTGIVLCRHGAAPRLDSFEQLALFVDLDGTLIEIADTPDGVICPPELAALLRSLEVILEGAIAVVSGRSLEQVDEVLKPLVLPGAGVYGAELRLHPDGAIARQSVPELAGLADRLRHRFDSDDRIVVEDKRSAVALHFRRAPERERECRQVLAELAAGPSLRILQGKCVVEAAPAGSDKGAAVKRLMAAPPFVARKPVFIGDDVADEAAFAMVAAHGGFGIKVGEGPSIASYRLATAKDVRRWLGDAVDDGEGRSP